MDDLIDQLQVTRRRAKDLVEGLTAEELNRRPAPDKWSIAECFAHLNKTAAAYQPLIDAAIRKGREDKILGKGPFNPGPLGRLMKWIAEPPPKFKIPAPRKILPPSSIADPLQVIVEFMRVQDEWERLAKHCEGLHQEKVRVKSPFTGLPPLRLCAPIPWMLAHQRRHLMQAEKTREELSNRAGSQSSH
jgi:DinB superfamily